MSSRGVNIEMFGRVVLQIRQRNTESPQGNRVCSSKRRVRFECNAEGNEQFSDARIRRRGIIRPQKPQSVHTTRTQINFERQLVFIHFGRMISRICFCSAQSIFFVREEYDPHRSSRTRGQSHHDARRIEYRRTTCSIIERPHTGIPRIEMRAKEDNLVRLFSTGDFTDDICTFGIRKRFAFERHGQAYRFS